MNAKRLEQSLFFGLIFSLICQACSTSSSEVTPPEKTLEDPQPGLSIQISSAQQGNIFADADLLQVFVLGSDRPAFFLTAETSVKDGTPAEALRIGDIPVRGNGCVNVGVVAQKSSDNEIVSGGSQLAKLVAGEESKATIRVTRELLKSRSVPGLGNPVDIAVNESRTYILSENDAGTGDTNALLTVVQGETFITSSIFLTKDSEAEILLTNPSSIAVTPGGFNETHRVFIGSEDGLLVMLQVSDPPSTLSFTAANIIDISGNISSLAVSPDGQTLLVADRSNKLVHVFNIHEQQGLRPVRIFKPRNSSPIPIFVAFNPTGEWAGVVYDNDFVSVIDTGLNKSGIYWEVDTIEISRASGIGISRDGQHAFVTSTSTNGGQIAYLTINALSAENPISVTQNTPLASLDPTVVRVSPGGGTLYVLSPATSQVALLSAIPDETGQLSSFGAITLKNTGGGPVSSAKAMQISPDGKTLRIIGQTADGLLDVSVLGGEVPSDACQ